MTLVKKGTCLMAMEDSLQETPHLPGEAQSGLGQAEEKELYAHYYNIVRSALPNADLADVASTTGLKERRIREVIRYRVSRNGPRLFGLEAGHCYVCQSHLPWSEHTEPICLECLSRIIEVMSPLALHQAPIPSTVEEHLPAFTPDSGDTVSRQEYERVLQELAYYKQQMTLRNEEPTGQTPEAAPETILAELEAGLMINDLASPEVQADLTDKNEAEAGFLSIANREEADEEETFGMPGVVEFLAILDLPDHEVITELPLPPVNGVLCSTEGLRHYGFKKLRAR